MAMNRMGNLVGSWAFLIGVILAIIFALFGELGPGITITLVIIGIIVGLLNVADEESQPFMMAGIVLIIASAFGGEQASNVIPFLGRILNALLIIFVPATIIVAIKSVFDISRT